MRGLLIKKSFKGTHTQELQSPMLSVSTCNYSFGLGCMVNAIIVTLQAIALGKSRRGTGEGKGEGEIKGK